MNEDYLTLATELTNDLETAEDEFVGYVWGQDAARSQNKIDATNQQLITPEQQQAAKEVEQERIDAIKDPNKRMIVEEFKKNFPDANVHFKWGVWIYIYLINA